MKLFFSDYFQISPDTLQKYGALNISLVNDLPLFIDPFLLFNSDKSKYQELHEEIIKYMIFLKEMSLEGSIKKSLLSAWFTFPEVKQNWLGFSLKGNNGRGLGMKFAKELNTNLNTIFRNFGKEEIYNSSHLEKMCLVRNRIGRDNISDFTTNLIKDFLASYTQSFGDTYLSEYQVKEVVIDKAYFDYNTRNWASKKYKLPWVKDSYILLVPLDILTKDEAWINRQDLINSFERIAKALSNDVLCSQVNEYLLRRIAMAESQFTLTKKLHKKIIEDAIDQFPEMIDFYIKDKIENGDKAKAEAKNRVDEVVEKFIENISKLVEKLSHLKFYEVKQKEHWDLLEKIKIFKDTIENNNGNLFFYFQNKPISIDNELQIIFRLIWFADNLNIVSKENQLQPLLTEEKVKENKSTNLIKISIANNKNLKNNFLKFYAKNQTIKDVNHLSVYIVIYFTDGELDRVSKIIHKLKLTTYQNIILIDARLKNANQSECNKNCHEKTTNNIYYTHNEINIVELSVNFRI